MSARVLIIENDPDIITISHATLTEAGFEVDVATNVGDALAACERSTPDLALVDIRLGMRATGWEFIRAVLKSGNWPSMHLAVFSVHAEEDEYLAEAEALGIGAVVTKNGDPRILLHEVRRLLN